MVALANWIMVRLRVRKSPTRTAEQRWRVCNIEVCRGTGPFEQTTARQNPRKDIDIPLKACSLYHSFRCSTHHARIARVLLWQCFHRIWQAVTAIPVVDPCRMSMKLNGQYCYGLTRRRIVRCRRHECKHPLCETLGRKAILASERRKDLSSQKPCG